MPSFGLPAKRSPCDESRRKVVMNLFSARYALRSLRHVPLGLFTAVFIGLFIHSFLDALNGNFDKWALSDWLINYEGGFVRRGFGGSLFHFFWVNFAIDVERHIIFLSYFSYLLISLYYVSAVIRSSSYLNGLVMAIWLFLPSLVLFALLDHSAIGRKEILFYIPLLVNLYLFNRNNLIRMTARNITEPLKNHSIKVYGFQVFFIFNLIAIPIVLIHESFLFLSLPLNFIVSLTILSKVLKMRIALVFTSLLYLPTAIVAGICFIYRGSTDIAKKICASWVASGMVDCDPDLPGAIDGLSWSFSKAVSLPYAVLTSDGGLVALHWFILFAVNLLLICFAASKLIDRYLNLHYYRCGNPSGIVQRTLFKYLTLPIVASLPLYVV